MSISRKKQITSRAWGTPNRFQLLGSYNHRNPRKGRSRRVGKLDEPPKQTLVKTEERYLLRDLKTDLLSPALEARMTLSGEVLPLPPEIGEWLHLHLEHPATPRHYRLHRLPAAILLNIADVILGLYKGERGHRGIRTLPYRLEFVRGPCEPFKLLMSNLRVSNAFIKLRERTAAVF
jgi:hypothetical protein